jgi:hypothetical protein
MAAAGMAAEVSTLAARTSPVVEHEAVASVAAEAASDPGLPLA